MGGREQRGGGVHTKKEKQVRSYDTTKYTIYGHQFKGHVIRILGIEAFHAAQSIVDILGHPIWWCEV